MTNILCQAALPSATGLTEDTVVNNWSFDVTSGSTSTKCALIVTALNSFYGVIDQYLSNFLAGTIAYKFYDRADPTPRVPVHEGAGTVTPGTNTIPTEVALCMSFQAARVSGLNQARRRGRVFLGPLAEAATTNNTGRPAAAFITAIDTAGSALLAASIAATDWKWVVWSSANNSFSYVANGWVDNAYDTQRSRGFRPTSRTLIT